ncbi:hypothetical protein [Actinocatenispora rupis]|uniref:Uncharacterized protein n=1 Tax=Actinocatenispora rupis TaxID=519421 RepID=A0A8J3NEJ6_9ACTN|nr:hypothetical protein [Actinocatenispora rupis]GID16131.1 hypothetical protein Aru02nite_70200 [Actinocatenispora rupis]
MHAETVTPTDSAARADPPVLRLGRTGRWVRIAVTVLGAALLLAGTLVGQDDDFPFGPFRMYATADRLDEPVTDTRLSAVDASGRRFALTDDATGFRRAEVEGQLPRFEKHPELLSGLATAYARRQPGRPRLVRIDVVVRLIELRDGRPTGKYTQRTVVSWSAR